MDQTFQVVIANLVTLAVQAAFVAIAGFVVLIVKRVAAKYGLQVDAIGEARLKATVQDILIGVEEEVEARVKRSTTPVLNTASLKFETAVTRVIDAVPGISTLEAQQLVRQELPKLGLGAAGFVTEVVKRATGK